MALVDTTRVIRLRKDDFSSSSSNSEPKVVRKNDDAPIIKEWVSDNKEDDVSQPKIEKKTIRPSIAKMKLVKSKQQEKTTKKTVKQVEQHRQNTHSPKGNQKIRKGNPQVNLQDQGVIDNGWSRHMTENMSYLTDYEEIDGGYVAFGENPKGRKIIGKATKDETSGILKSFITRIENLVDDKVKVIRCDNKTKFKNREMNQFCEMNGILRQFSVARTPQQNGVTERRNKTLIKAARTVLAGFKLPTTFLAEVVNIACYVQNRVLVVKPHNKAPYELFQCRTPTLSFMRPFKYPVTILNTIDHLGKFDGKTDEGFFVVYSLNTKAFRVFNTITRRVKENLHIRFSESTPNVETLSAKDYILLPLWTTNTSCFQDTKSSHDDGSKPSSDDGKKVDEDPRKENECNDQEKEDNVNNTNNVNTVSSTVNVAGTNKDNKLPFDPNMPALEDVSIFNFSSDDENNGPVADMNNLDTTIQVSRITTTTIHKDLPLDQVIRDFQLATQTRKMSKNLKEHEFVSTIQQRTNHKDLQNCLFACFLSQEEPKKKKKDGIFISQDKYVAEILKKFGFTEVKTVSTPIETQKPLHKDEDGEEVYVHMYRSMIGSLMYLTSLRPDIMFAVCDCARYQVSLKVSHLHAVKRILKYLKGHPKLGLWYLKDSPFDLVAYTDSDYAEASLDRRLSIL
nr:putative ribonuclease H-like domain-containing protein [Tanacetum cinerariifolium]